MLCLLLFFPFFSFFICFLVFILLVSINQCTHFHPSFFYFTQKGRSIARNWKRQILLLHHRRSRRSRKIAKTRGKQQPLHFKGQVLFLSFFLSFSVKEMRERTEEGGKLRFESHCTWLRNNTFFYFFSFLSGGGVIACNVEISPVPSLQSELSALV